MSLHVKMHKICSCQIIAENSVIKKRQQQHFFEFIAIFFFFYFKYLKNICSNRKVMTHEYIFVDCSIGFTLALFGFQSFNATVEDNCVGLGVTNVVHKWRVGIYVQQCSGSYFRT